jgi:capsular polysaccharide transport system ATP-binding protein
MIWFDNVTKYYQTLHGPRAILNNSSFSFNMGHNYGILGANGVGKSTLLRMISGALPPNRGTITRKVRVSFPVGFSGTFHGHLSGRQNATFLARVYGEDVRRVTDFVFDFSELGTYFDMPIQTYSSGMIAKFAFGLSFAIDFDVYLVDEVTEVGDARFRAKCLAMFRDRMARSDIIMVSHNSHTIKAYCDRGAIMHNGNIEFFSSINEAMRVYNSISGSVNE